MTRETHEDYRRKADRCRRLAQHCSDREVRARLLQLAREYDDKCAEAFQRGGLVTSPRSQGPTP